MGLSSCRELGPFSRRFGRACSPFFAGFSNLFPAFWLLMGVSKFGQIFLRYSNQVLLGLHVFFFFFFFSMMSGLATGV